MAESLGTLSVDLMANTAAFKKSMEGATTKASKATAKIKKGFSSARSAANTHLPKIGAAAGAAAGGLATVVNKSLRAQESLGDLTSNLGASAKEFSRLQFAATQTGSSAESLEKGVGALQKRLGQAIQKGTGPAADAFESLGLNMEEVAEKSPTEQLDAIREKMVQLEGPVEQNAIAAQLFSRENQDLVGPLTQTTEEMDKLRQKSDDLGQTISDSEAAMAQMAGVAIDNVKRALGGLTNQITAGIAPALKGMSEAFTKSVTGAEDSAEKAKSFGEKVGKWVATAADVLRSFYTTAKFVFDTVGKYLGAAAASWVKAFGSIKETISSIAEAVKLVFRGDFVGAKNELADNFKKQADKMKGIWSGFTEDIKGSFEENIANFDSTKFRDAVKESYKKANEEGKKAVESSQSPLPSGGTAPGAANDGDGGQAEQIEKAKEKQSEFNQLVKDLQGPQKDALEAAKRRVDIIDKETEKLREQNKTLGNRQELLNKVSGGLISEGPDVGPSDTEVGGAASGLLNAQDRMSEVNEWQSQEQAKLDEHLATLREKHKDNNAKLIADQAAYESAKEKLDSKAMEKRQKAQQEYWKAGSKFAQKESQTALDLLEKMGKEGSAAYKTLFLANKAAAIANTIVNTEAAATKAFTLGPVAGPVVAGTIRGLGYASVGTIAGTAIAGVAHDGIDEVPSDGTWNLQKGERVTDARTNEDLKQFLASSKDGRQGGATVNMIEDSEKAGRSQQRDDGGTDVFVNDIKGGGEMSQTLEQTYPQLRRMGS